MPFPGFLKHNQTAVIISATRRSQGLQLRRETRSNGGSNAYHFLLGQTVRNHGEKGRIEVLTGINHGIAKGRKIVPGRTDTLVIERYDAKSTEEKAGHRQNWSRLQEKTESKLVPLQGKMNVAPKQIGKQHRREELQGYKPVGPGLTAAQIVEEAHQRKQQKHSPIAAEATDQG